MRRDMALYLSTLRIYRMNGVRVSLCRNFVTMERAFVSPPGLKNRLNVRNTGWAIDADG